MSFFKNKRISLHELKKTFLKSSGVIPRGYGRRYSREDRKMLFEEVFGSKYGYRISNKDYKRAIYDFEKKKSEIKTKEERKIIEDKIRYLKKIERKLYHDSLL